MPLLLEGAVVTVQLLVIAGILVLCDVLYRRIWPPIPVCPSPLGDPGGSLSFSAAHPYWFSCFGCITPCRCWGINLPSGLVGIVALTLNYGSYGSEMVRSAILAIPRGQTEAGIALNMTPAQRMRSIILPQAFRIMLPSFGNLLIELLKGTALVSLVSISEMTINIIQMRNTVGHDTQLLSLLLVGLLRHRLSPDAGLAVAGKSVPRGEGVTVVWNWDFTWHEVLPNCSASFT